MQSIEPTRPTAEWKFDQLNQVMTLNVGIPHGWQVKLHLKCTPSRINARDVFDLPTSLQNTGREDKWLDIVDPDKRIGTPTRDDLNSQLKDLEDNARRLALGHFDQLTPATELILIHAVKQPRKTSAINQPFDATTKKPAGYRSIQVQQFYDSPLAQLTLAVDIGDRRSTGAVELVAS